MSTTNIQSCLVHATCPDDRYGCIHNTYDKSVFHSNIPDDIDKEPLEVSDWSQPIKLILMVLFIFIFTAFGFRILDLLQVIANK